MGRDTEVRALCSRIREERIAIVSGEFCGTHRSHLQRPCPGYWCKGMPVCRRMGGPWEEIGCWRGSP